MAAELMNLDALASAIADKLLSKSLIVPRLMDLDQAASYLGMTPDALKHKALSGKIPGVKLDKKWRFDREDLDLLIVSHKQQVA